MSKNRTWLVIDDGGDWDTWITWCGTAEEAIQRSRGHFGHTDEEPGDLRAVNADAVQNDATCETLLEIERVCAEAIEVTTAALPSIAQFEHVERDAEILRDTLRALCSHHRTTVGRLALGLHPVGAGGVEARVIFSVGTDESAPSTLKRAFAHEIENVKILALPLIKDMMRGVLLEERELCAAIAERLGHPQVAEQIRARAQDEKDPRP